MLVLADFTGREDEIRRMSQRLRSEGGKVGLSSVRGMAGVGKTSLAVYVGHAVKEHFPDAQLVVELNGASERPLTAVDAMSRIIRAFHPEAGKLPDEETALLPLYRGVLHGKRALILLDNAADEVQVKPLLSVPPPVAFIVTSRNTLALDGVDSVRLDILPPDKARELLRSIVGDNGTDYELNSVAELCGRLPLALRVAGDFLRLHDNWTIQGYTDALRKEPLKRLKGNSMDRDVERVLAFSALILVKENAELANNWQMSSVFPGSFASTAAAAVW
jgi:NB-ARC domain